MDLPVNPSAIVELLRAWFFAKDRSIIMADDTFIEGDEIATPGNPVSGRRRLYAKDDCWYELDSDGNEVSLCNTNDVEYVIIADEKTATTAGGTFTSGAWRTRDFTVTKLNTIATGYSLAANQFVLPSGSYIVFTFAPAYRVNNHKTRLYNITDGATEVVGTSNYSDSGNNVNTMSFVLGSFIITSSKTFELQHRSVTTQATNGFGNPTSVGEVEVYSQVWIIKYA